eukprot:TRINITY_DN10038_c0_g1_i2.p1 TRINITY_DN10038_c0_g1~~TRINITY_DN10038_c0_g1_i2.p1  ORF type:complete len:320 (-),score=73.21 TRINITY_DN10038_c0_g1_i2:116-1075(-)
MWSVGCILAEMIVGKAIFPGTSTLNQIERVLELIGKPRHEDVEALQSPLAWNIISNTTITKKKSFHTLFANASEDAIDLIRKLLVFNPNNRLTVEEALQHRYLAQFSCQEEEITHPTVIGIPMNDNKKYSIREYREALYQEIGKKKKEERKMLIATLNSGLEEPIISETEVHPEPVAKQQPTRTGTASSTHSTAYQKSKIIHEKENEKRAAAVVDERRLSGNLNRSALGYAAVNNNERGGSNSNQKTAQPSVAKSMNYSNGLSAHVSVAKGGATQAHHGPSSAAHHSFSSNNSSYMRSSHQQGFIHVRQSSQTGISKKR